MQDLDDGWLREVRREWRGPDLRVTEMMTGVVRVCINDTCFSSGPNEVSAEELARVLRQAGIPLEETSGGEDNEAPDLAPA